MAVGVVDRLEVVDIRHQHRQGARGAFGPFDFLMKPRVDVGAIEEARQRIDRRRIGKAMHFRVVPGGDERQRR